MASKVLLVTEPKPTAIIVMPSAFRVAAVCMAAEEPPKPLLCSPSVNTIAMREYIEGSIVSSSSLAFCRPSPMLVPPIVV